MAIACGASGTRCGRLIFIFFAGMRHSASAKSNSAHSPCRSSPGRTKNSGASLSAYLVTVWPSKPSIARSSAPTALGSTIVARCVTVGVISAPRRSAVGSRSARPVAMAKRKTAPTVLRARVAVSCRPRFSIFRSGGGSYLGAVITRKIPRVPWAWHDKECHGKPNPVSRCKDASALGDRH
jgi:hypothetical protein